MSIAVLGTLALDTVKTHRGQRKNILGGSAAHFAMSARLFTPVDLVAVIGRDFPASHLNFLRGKGVILDAVSVGEGSTFKWNGRYDKDNLNLAITLKTELGVLADFNPKLTERQRYIKYLFLANIDPDIQRFLLKSMRALKLVGLDSMNYWITNKKSSLKNILKGVDIYLANENEARELSGEHNLAQAARYLKRLGPPIVIIKKGEHGVLMYSDKFVFSLPAYPVMDIIDPTGAGDTFAGGFMGYLAKANSLREGDIRRAIAYGVVCASFNVEGFGLEATARLKLRDVQNRLRDLRCITSYGL